MFGFQKDEKKEDKPLSSVDVELGKIFGSSSSVSGEEELLRIASKYSIQLSNNQIRQICFHELMADLSGDPFIIAVTNKMITRFLELKQYVGSDIYIMRALEAMALKKFVEQNGIQLRAER